MKKGTLRLGLCVLTCVAAGLGCTEKSEHKELGVIDGAIPESGGQMGSSAFDVGPPPDPLRDAGRVVLTCADKDGGCVPHAPLTSSGGRLDLLFVVDNSISMKEEQTALAEQFPRMLSRLTSGDHDGDGEVDHTPITDLHLGVVSPDLGMSDHYTCADDGDNGRLLHAPTATAQGMRTCETSYPTFLTYVEGEDPDQLANDFACIALLGIDGCGFEQPLEAALKALWPSADPRMSFLGQTPGGELSRGDRDNAGFVRRDPNEPTTLGLVIVTDEDDCSTFDLNLFQISSGVGPYAGDPANLRCFLHPESMYPIERYLFGYRSLPLAAGSRVVFAAIAGIPVDLVDRAALADVDFQDTAERNAFYDGILSDPRMEKKISDEDPTALTPACESELGKAEPAQRLVEVAKAFGSEATVQSICGDDLSVPIDIVIRTVVEELE